MHLGLIANLDWLYEEPAIFRSLIVGCLDEPVRVTQIVPDQVTQHMVSDFAERVSWRDSRFASVRRFRMRAMQAVLTERQVTLLHALDSRVWIGAMDLAEAMDVPLVLTVGSIRDVDRAVRYRGRLTRCRCMLIAATKPMAQTLEQRMGTGVIVRHLPPGVHVREQTCPTRQAQDPLCVLVSGNGQVDEDYLALLAAMRHVVEQNPDAQFFFDGQGREQHRLWQTIRKMGMIPQANLVPHQIARRELVRGAHVLVHPQALGEVHSVSFQAMAYGLPILAQQDPWLDYLLAETTAWLVPSDRSVSTPNWRELLERVLREPDAAVELGQRARQWVREDHSAGEYVQKLLALYHHAAAESYKFEPQAADENEDD